MKNIHELEIEIKGSEWTDILDKVFVKKQKDLKIDGFRKGSVPKDVYLKKFGIESLFMDAVDEVIPVAFNKLMEKNDLVPVIQPKVDIKHICGDCVSLVFTITTKPEVKLGKYTNLGVKKEKVEVSNEEIDTEIENIRTKMAEIIEKTDGELVDGNTAVIDFEGFVDGELLEGGKGNNYPLEIGSNTFIPGFETGLIGMKVNETRELNLKFPENYDDKLKNKDVLFKVTLRVIKERIMPTINEEFYKDLGYENIKNESEFRDEIKKSIISKKELEVENKYIEDVLSKATENIEVELSDDLINDETDRMISQYEQQLKMQGLSIEQYFEFTKTTREDLAKNMLSEATRRIKARYLLEAVIEKEKIEVSNEEIDEEVKKMTEMYNMTKEDLLSNIGGIDMIGYDMKMRKAIDLLKNN